MNRRYLIVIGILGVVLVAGVAIATDVTDTLLGEPVCFGDDGSIEAELMNEPPEMETPPSDAEIRDAELLDENASVWTAINRAFESETGDGTVYLSHEELKRVMRTSPLKDWKDIWYFNYKNRTVKVTIWCDL